MHTQCVSILKLTLSKIDRVILFIVNFFVFCKIPITCESNYCGHNTFSVRCFLNDRLECVLDDFNFKVYSYSKISCQLILLNYKTNYKLIII